MRAKILQISVLVFALASVMVAQDISGKWQGMLRLGENDVRVIVKIEKAADGGWNGKFYPVGRDWDAFLQISSISLQGAEVKFTMTGRWEYQGTVSLDGNSIQGTWTQAKPQALKFERATPATEWKDPSPHTVQFVTVDTDVRLEVLDWGGSGRPLVLIPGGGATAHSYDAFAPRFTNKYHVYGITRRGFGDSSAPASGYTSTRLGDDVIAVLDALKINRPVLAGQSIAGEELSSVGSRHPERVAGLIYLDAAYPYAFYDSAHGDIYIDLSDLKKKLEQLDVANEPPDPRPLIRELLEKDLPQFERDLRERQKDLEAWPPDPTKGSPTLPVPIQAMFRGMEKYTRIPVPVLAIYAVPHDGGQQIGDPKVRAAAEARDLITTGAQAAAFEKAVPTARVVRWPHANHNLVWFHEAEVIKEMNAFLSSLPN